MRNNCSSLASAHLSNMSTLRAIAYLSSTSVTLADAQLDALLLDARSFNESVKVTGALLYNGTAFFQYFEGDSDACEAVYQRVRASSRHHSIHTIADVQGSTRYFPSWSMAYSSATGSQTLAISQAQWLASPANQDTLSQGASSGIAMLVAFWRAASGVS